MIIVKPEPPKVVHVLGMPLGSVGTLVKTTSCKTYDGELVMRAYNCIVALGHSEALTWSWKHDNEAPDFEVELLPAGTRIVLEQRHLG